MENTLLLQKESERIQNKAMTSGLAIGAGGASLALLSTNPANAQAVAPVTQLNTEVTNLSDLADAAIPVATGVIAFMIGALIVGRVMRS